MLRPGDLTARGTPYAGIYVNELIVCIGGTLAGLDPICEQVAGAPIRQSSAVPTLRAQRVATIYGVVLHILTLVLLIASAAVALVAADRAAAVSAVAAPVAAADRAVAELGAADK